MAQVRLLQEVQIGPPGLPGSVTLPVGTVLEVVSDSDDACLTVRREGVVERLLLVRRWVETHAAILDGES